MRTEELRELEERLEEIDSKGIFCTDEELREAKQIQEILEREG